VKNTFQKNLEEKSQEYKIYRENKLKKIEKHKKKLKSLLKSIFRKK